MITDGQKWHYLAVTKLSALFRIKMLRIAIKELELWKSRKIFYTCKKEQKKQNIKIKTMEK